MNMDIEKIISSHQGRKWFDERLSRLHIYNVHSIGASNIKDELLRLIESIEDNDTAQTIVIYSKIEE